MKWTGAGRGATAWAAAALWERRAESAGVYGPWAARTSASARPGAPSGPPCPALPRPTLAPDADPGLARSLPGAAGRGRVEAFQCSFPRPPYQPPPPFRHCDAACGLRPRLITLCPNLPDAARRKATRGPVPEIAAINCHLRPARRRHAVRRQAARSPAQRSPCLRRRPVRAPRVPVCGTLGARGAARGLLAPPSQQASPSHRRSGAHLGNNRNYSVMAAGSICRRRGAG